MKLPTLLLAGSLAVNAALAVVYFSRLSSRAAPSRGAEVATAKAPANASSGGQLQPSQNSSRGKSTEQGGTGGGASTADLRALAARLKQAGFPLNMIRAVISAQISERFRARQELLALIPGEQPFWKTDSLGYSPLSRALTDPKFRSASRALSLEQSQLLKEILGADAIPTGSQYSDYQTRRYGNLPPDKIEQLERLDQDYNDLRNDLTRIANRVRLPEDVEKLAILEREKRADLVQLLSPAEAEDYLVRTSNTTSQLRAVMTAANGSEEEFRAIYRLQSAYDEKYSTTLGGSTTAEQQAERQAAQTQVDEDIRAMLGDSRYAEFVRAADQEFQQLTALAKQANLPESAALQMVAMRDSLVNESNRIYDDASLNSDQKRAALQALAQTARTQAVSTLGSDAGAKYLQSAANNWVGGLERGYAMKMSSSIKGARVTSTRTLPQSGPPASPR